MKKAVALLLLFALSAYTFNLKTHYCFHTDSGERYHGDCAHEIKSAAQKGDLASSNFFADHYTCFDFTKSTVSQEARTITAHVLVTYIITGTFTFSLKPLHLVGIDWIITEFHCRGVPIYTSGSLRGPPLV
jgi:hypothetical protein